MYLQNKYTLWYNNIILSAKNRTLSGYTERHHIIPRSLGGSDDISNIAILTAREHFICHLLLPKMLEGPSKYKMTAALMGMTNRRSSRHKRYTVTNRTYEIVRKQWSEIQKGFPKHSEKTKILLSQMKTGKPGPNKGRRMSEEQKKKISEALKGRITSQETRDKISASNTGKTRTPEARARYSAAKRKSSTPDF